MRLLTEFLSIHVKPSYVVAHDNDELAKIVIDEIKRVGPTGSLNHIDVSEVTNFNDIFLNIDERFNCDVSEWDVSKMKSCEFLFSCTSFDGDLSTWDVSNCENFGSMFNTNSAFTGKGLENWNLKKAKTLSYMFHKTYAFTGNTIVGWRLPAKLEEIDNMFKNAIALEVDLSSWNVSRMPIKNKSQMFDHCSKMRVEWLPKGIDPNLMNLNPNPSAIHELKGRLRYIQK